jgi:hypothetical protein
MDPPTKIRRSLTLVLKCILLNAFLADVLIISLAFLKHFTHFLKRMYANHYI